MVLANIINSVDAEEDDDEKPTAEGGQGILHLDDFILSFCQ